MQFKIEILINRPRVAVWAFFTDPEKTKLWQPTLISIEPVHGIRGQLDAEAKWMYKENEREFSLTEKVLLCEEPSRFESQFENEFAKNVVKHVFIEQSKDQTLWVAETTYMFKTLLMKILGPIAKKNYAARSQQEMERFKERIENE